MRTSPAKSPGKERRDKSARRVVHEDLILPAAIHIEDGDDFAMQMSHFSASPERVYPSAIAEHDKPENKLLQQYESSRVSLNAFDALNNSLLPVGK